ncbi:hypothetical protein C9422_14825 [Pseudomonas sp. B1(2018)]|nr:hypothetical protein C9422_14825 [Pseudomonas sp. B1(2018)]
MGASLLAMTVHQPTSFPNVRPLSRASSLPQGLVQGHRPSPIAPIAGVNADNPLESRPRLKETTSC